MPNPYTVFVRVAALLADSASMFAGFAIIGFIANQPASPLSWPVTLAVLAAGTLALHAIRRLTPSGAFALYGGVGLIVSYAAASGGSDMGWVASVLQGRTGVAEAIGAGLAFLASGYLWFHAASLVLDPDLTRRLVRRFRFGIVWFVLALIVEVGSGRDLQVDGLLWLFLVAGLAALAVNRFGGGLGASSFRLRLAAFMVLFVVGFGAVAGAIGSHVGHGVWSVVTAVLRWPLEALRDAYLWAVGSVFEPIIGADSSFRDGADGASSDLGRFRQYDPNASIMGIEWQGWAVLAIVAFLAYLIYRFYLGPSDDVDEQQKLGREPTDDALPFVGDGLRLVRGLASRRARRLWKTAGGSAGPDGRAETFEIYRRLVTVACDRGHAFDEAETPNERAADLEAVLPGAPIGKLTALVNRACFAGREIDAPTIDGLQREVDAALSDKRN